MFQPLSNFERLRRLGRIVACGVGAGEISADSSTGARPHVSELDHDHMLPAMEFSDHSRHDTDRMATMILSDDDGHAAEAPSGTGLTVATIPPPPGYLTDIDTDSTD